MTVYHSVIIVRMIIKRLNLNMTKVVIVLPATSIAIDGIGS